MNYLVFVGSPRPLGNTSVLSKGLKQILQDRGHSFDFVYTSGNYKPCLHCGMCVRNDKPCVIKDDLEVYLKQFDGYDSIIFMTPIYFFGFTAQSKVFLDRMYSTDWNDKTISLVTSSGSRDRMGGNDLLVESLVRSCEYKGGTFTGFYNKVTNDKVLPFTNKDEKNLLELVINTERAIHHGT